MTSEKKQELLRLENLSVEYKTGRNYLSAVRGVNLAVNRGEVLAVVGESGCGKSTLAHAIMRLLGGHNNRVSGEILFDGQDLTKLSDKEIRAIRGHKIGMIFQNPLDSLNPVYRVGGQVEEAILLDHKTRAQAAKETEALFAEVKMPDPASQMVRFPHELSGGLRQRVMIAMMLSRYPELLIADEPTTALDVTIEAQIMDILLRLKTEHNTAILLITHNFGIVAEAADRIAVMYAGEIVEQGSVYEIFDDPCHPYTYLLMSALPRQTKREGRLRTIEGSVPRLTADMQGCRFANRCPWASEQCRSTKPTAQSAGGTHSFHCHLPKEERPWLNR